MAFKVTKRSNSGYEFFVDDISELNNLPTDTKKGTGGKMEEDNMQVPLGSTALFGTGEVAALFPNGWQEL